MVPSGGRYTPKRAVMYCVHTAVSSLRAELVPTKGFKLLLVVLRCTRTLVSYVFAFDGLTAYRCCCHIMYCWYWHQVCILYHSSIDHDHIPMLVYDRFRFFPVFSLLSPAAISRLTRSSSRKPQSWFLLFS